MHNHTVFEQKEEAKRKFLALLFLMVIFLSAYSFSLTKVSFFSVKLANASGSWTSNFLFVQESIPQPSRVTYSGDNNLIIYNYQGSESNDLVESFGGIGEEDSSLATLGEGFALSSTYYKDFQRIQTALIYCNNNICPLAANGKVKKDFSTLKIDSKVKFDYDKQEISIFTLSKKLRIDYKTRALYNPERKSFIVSTKGKYQDYELSFLSEIIYDSDQEIFSIVSEFEGFTAISPLVSIDNPRFKTKGGSDYYLPVLHILYFTASLGKVFN